MVNKWIDLALEDFLNSPQGAKLSKEAKRYTYLIRMFCEGSYNYYDDLPGNWSSFLVFTMCADYIPRKLIAPKATFKCLPRILHLFFEWAGQKGVINNAKELQNSLKLLDII